MEQDFTYSGFFKITEKDNGLEITVHKGCQGYDNLTSYGTWLKGDLLISADGNYIEANVDKAYEVNYSWSSITYERALEMSNLVYIDTPVYEKKWFGLSERKYYPPNTRYIVDRTKHQHGVRRYFNHTMTLLVK